MMHDTAPIPKRPVLRYHGGKWRLAKWVISHFPPHRVYVEPFGGAASVLLQQIPCQVEVYNDLNCRLVNLFQVLRDRERAAQLIRLLEMTPFAYDEFKTSHSVSADPVEDARRLISLSYMSVGTDGAARPGRSAGFRHYSGRPHSHSGIPVKEWPTLPASIATVAERIQGRVVVENRDGIEVMQLHDGTDTLHYVDPPYMKSSRSDKGNDYEFEMDDDQHRHLATVLKGLTGMVVLSGYPSELYDNEFADWFRVERSHVADRSAMRIEVLWLNPAASEALAGTRLPLFDR